MKTAPANRPILLIEDNPLDVDLTRRAFARKKLSHPLIVARDGEQALDWLPRWEAGAPLPLIILLDLNLPRISGLDVLAHLKAHPSFRVIPVVVLTSSVEDRDVQMAYLQGANSYIVKPIDFHQFLEIVDQIDRYWCVLNEPA